MAIAIVAVIAVAGFFMLVQPDKEKPYSDEVSQQIRSQNANLLGALYSGGIVDPFVDIDDERVYVAYDLPDGQDSDIMQRFAIGASADAAPTVKKIVISQYQASKAKLIWSLSMADFKSFMNAQFTGDQLDAKIEKTAL